MVNTIKISSLLQSFDELSLIGPLGPLCQELKNQIAIDGGIQYSHNPLMWMGDGDSSNKEDRDKLPHILFPITKNFSDLKGALDLVKNYSIKEIHLWGFEGKRIDHFLANVGESFHFIESSRTQIIYWYNSLGKKSMTFYPPGIKKVQLYGDFSVLTLKPNTIQIMGHCAYLLEKKQIQPFSSYTLSNIGKGDIQIEAESAFAIYHET